MDAEIKELLLDAKELIVSLMPPEHFNAGEQGCVECRDNYSDVWDVLAHIDAITEEAE